MNGLRVYISNGGAEARADQKVFYSRRADGPFYRWRYEEPHGLWRFSRVHLSRLTLRVLSVANWQAVPAALQTRLGEHYME
jgi:hypothetical protein